MTLDNFVILILGIYGSDTQSLGRRLLHNGKLQLIVSVSSPQYIHVHNC